MFYGIFFAISSLSLFYKAKEHVSIKMGKNTVLNKDVQLELT